MGDTTGPVLVALKPVVLNQIGDLKMQGNFSPLVQLFFSVNSNSNNKKKQNEIIFAVKQMIKNVGHDSQICCITS